MSEPRYPYPMIVHHDSFGMPNLIELCMRVLDLGQLCRGVIHRTIQGPYCSKCGNPHPGVMYQKVEHPHLTMWTEQTGWTFRDAVQSVPTEEYRPADAIAAKLGPDSSFAVYLEWRNEMDKAEGFIADLCGDNSVDVLEFRYWSKVADSMVQRAISHFQRLERKRNHDA